MAWQLGLKGNGCWIWGVRFAPVLVSKLSEDGDILQRLDLSSAKQLKV